MSSTVQDGGQVGQGGSLNAYALAGVVGDNSTSMYLTPDALLNYCASRMRDLDTQINYAMQGQQQAQHENKILTDLQQKLALDISGDEDMTNVGGMQNVAAAAADLREAAAALKDTDASTASKLNAMADALAGPTAYAASDAEMAGYPNAYHAVTLANGQQGYWDDTTNRPVYVTPLKQKSGTYKEADFKTAVLDPIKGVQSDLNSGSELAMINLQSLMSQRQSAIQTVTNMVQQVGDSMNKIAANIGH